MVERRKIGVNCPKCGWKECVRISRKKVKCTQCRTVFPHKRYREAEEPKGLQEATGLRKAFLAIFTPSRYEERMRKLRKKRVVEKQGKELSPRNKAARKKRVIKSGGTVWKK